MPIAPDTKDWTWVLTRRCPQCGLDSGSVVLEHIPEMVRQNVAGWRVALRRPGVRDRPADDHWSALEYACHVRDVFRIFDRRLTLMLEQDDPLFENWDQDRTAIEDAYGTQDPAVVAEELAEAGEVIAAHFESLPDDAWSRTGRRSDGAVFTVESFARYFVHDPFHHLIDVTGGD